MNYSGKFKRDSQSRLDSCTLYKPSKDVTPAPTDTDAHYLEQRKSLIQAKMNSISERELSEQTHYTAWLQGVRAKNKPEFRSSKALMRGMVGPAIAHFF